MAVFTSTANCKLSCSVQKAFWINWKNGVLTLGLGNQIGVGKIIIYLDTSPISIKYLGVSTYSGSGTSYWTIPAAIYEPGNLSKFIENK